MAIQIWTPQYQRDNSAMAAGISSAGRSIGAGLGDLAERLEKKKEEEKRITVNAKAADTLYKNNPEMQKLIGLSPEMFSMLSGQDKIAHTAGAITHLTFQQAANKARMEREEMENNARFPNFARDMAESGAAPGSLPFDISEAEFDRRTAAPNIWASMARTGYRPREGTLDDLQRAMDGGAGGPAFFTPDQVGRGMAIVGPDDEPIPGTFQVPIGPKTSQIVIDPTQAQRPAGEKPGDEGSIEIPDTADPVFGPRIRIPLKVAREKYPHLLKGLEGGGGAPAPGAGPAGKPAPAASAPTITTQAEYDKLKSGDIYIDAASGKTKRKK